MQQVRAKKRLGQHFLKDLHIAQQIAETPLWQEPDLPVSGKMPVLEIGPGMGVLTQFLLRNPRFDVTAIEIDTESVDYLHEYYPELHVIEGDFLKLPIEKLYPEGQF